MSAVKSAEFVKGAVDNESVPRDLKPHIAFIGRSNVGKSSILNTLVGQKNLARSSSTPGRTTEANFFLINRKVYFVDLPGYGYAKQPKPFREGVLRLIEWYLTDERMPVHKVVLLVDAKVGVTKDDEEMLQLLAQEGDRLEIVVIANKIDKLKQSQQKAAIQKIQSMIPMWPVIPFSALKGIGKGEVLQTLFEGLL